MGKQRHDIGWKKQQPTSKPAPIASTEAMARRLVTIGLAAPQILDASLPGPRHDSTHTNPRSN